MIRTAVILLGMWMFPAGVAVADELSEARTHYDRGTTLFDLGKYIDAAHEYEATFSLKSDPALLFNIGQAYRLGGDNASAIRAYRSFLRRLPDAQNREEVERLVEGLRNAPARTQSGAVPISKKPDLPATAHVAVQSAPLSRPPVYKRWWPWTIVGVVVVGTAVGLTLALTIPKNANAPGAVPINFP